MSKTTQSSLINNTPVLVTDEVSENLISLSTLVDNNFHVIFDKNGVLIQSDQDSSINIYIPRSIDKFWRIDITDLNQILIDNNNISPVSNQYSNYYLPAYSARLHENITNIRDSVFYLHERMGHAPEDIMCLAIDSPNPTWINSNVSSDQIKRVFAKEPCLACIIGKRNHDSGKHLYRLKHSNDDIDNNTSSTQSASIQLHQHSPGDCLSIDIVPSISPLSIDDDKGYFAITDVATNYIHLIPLKEKTSESIIQAISYALRFYHRFNILVKFIRCDHESNLLSDEVDQYLADRHIVTQTSPTYGHYQNKVERIIQIINKSLSTMLSNQLWVRMDTWSEALNFWQQVHNRTPNKNTGYSSPHEIITNEKTDLSRQCKFPFGEMVIYGIPPNKREHKLDIRHNFGIHMGMTDNTIDTYRVYDVYSHRVYNRNNVHRLQVDKDQLLKHLVSRINLEMKKIPYRLVHDAVENLFSEQTNIENEEVSMGLSIPLIDYDNNSSSQNNGLSYVPIERHDQSIRFSATPSPLPSTYHVFSDDIDNYHRYIYKSYKAKVLDPDSPTISEALKSRERNEWVKAILAETNYLLQETFEPISLEDLPLNCKIVPTTIVLKRKRNPTTGLIDKYKGRICLRGDILRYFYEALEKSSPTINELTFNFILQLAIIMSYIRVSIDVVAAYLYQEYPFDKKPIAVKLQKEVAQLLGLDPNQLYKLKRYIYGLPDSGKAYYEAYSKHLIEHQYQQSQLDPCLFYKSYGNSDIIYICIHVDDTYVFASHSSYIDELIEVLKKQFDITVDMEADKYLGLSMTQMDDGSIVLKQPKLLQSLFNEYQNYIQNNGRKVTAPIKQSVSQQKELLYNTKSDSQSCGNITNEQKLLTNAYLHLLGTLMYLNRSRPDIKFATSLAATKSKCPTKDDYDQLIHIVRYLYHTKDIGLILHPLDKNDVIQFYCYVDASYLLHPDSHSHTGYLITFDKSGSFFSKSIKQKNIATSSTHAETIALYTLVKDIIYLIDLCSELKLRLKTPILVFEDNKPLVQMTQQNANGMKKCKHFLMSIAYIKECILRGLVSLNKIHTKHNPADILSKPSYGADFAIKRNRMLGIESSEKNEDNNEDVDNYHVNILYRGVLEDNA